MEFRTLKEAAEAENVSVPTMWKWVRRYPEIARRDGHVWHIDPERLRVIAEASRTLGFTRK